MNTIDKEERIKIGVSRDNEFNHAHMLNMNFEEFKSWMDENYAKELYWMFAVDLYNGDVETDPTNLFTYEAYDIWLEGKMLEAYAGFEKSKCFGMGGKLFMYYMEG